MSSVRGYTSNEENAWITAESFCLLSDSVTNVPVQWLFKVALTALLALEHLEAKDESPSLVKTCSQRFNE